MTGQYNPNRPILELEDLTIQYETDGRPVTAVSDASLDVEHGRYFGLAGESGCGKSTIVKSILGILDENGRIESGKIKYKGEEIQDYSQQELNEKIRWKEIAYIPQSSMDSLDPLKKIKTQAFDIAHTHTDMEDAEILKRLEEMFDIVGIPSSRIDDYPHQFSGGMQQRTIIALALFLDPSLIIADEPTTALDVIMQDQILRYLDEIKRETNVSMIMITHDISLIFETCDNMAIMHSGQIAETGSIVELYDSPKHPYSILLQEAFPNTEHPDRELQTIDGHPPQLSDETNFCTFVDRCPWAIPECQESKPPLEPVEKSGSTTSHSVACVRKDEVDRLYNEEQATSFE